MLPRKVSVILLNSALIYKQRLCHGDEIVQYFQNYKSHCVNQAMTNTILESTNKVLQSS